MHSTTHPWRQIISLVSLFFEGTSAHQLDMSCRRSSRPPGMQRSSRSKYTRPFDSTARFVLSASNVRRNSSRSPPSTMPALVRGREGQLRGAMCTAVRGAYPASWSVVERSRIVTWKPRCRRLMPVQRPPSEPARVRVGVSSVDDGCGGAERGRAHLRQSRRVAKT